MSGEKSPTHTTSNVPIPPDVLSRMREIERQQAITFYTPLFTAIREAVTNGPKMLAEEQRAHEKRNRADKERAEWIKRYRGRMFALVTAMTALLPTKKLGDGTLDALTKSVTSTLEHHLTQEEREGWLPRSNKEVLILLDNHMERSLQETIDGSSLSAPTRHFLQLPDTSPGGLEQISTQAILISELERHAKEVTRNRILESISKGAHDEIQDRAVLKVLENRVETEWRATFESLGYDHLVARFAALELRPSASEAAAVDNDGISLDELTTYVARALTNAHDALKIHDAHVWEELQKNKHLTDEAIESIKSSVLNTSPESLVDQILYNILPDATELERKEVASTLLRYGGLKFLLSLPPHSHQRGMSASRLLITEPMEWDRITPLRTTGTEADLDEIIKQHLLFLMQTLTKTFAPKESSFIPDARIEQLREKKAPQTTQPVTPESPPKTPTESRMAGEVVE